MPRPQEEPSHEAVLSLMNPCEPYTTGDLAAEFDDTSRWTVERRLETLVEEGKVKKKKHAANRVSWWRDPE